MAMATNLQYLLQIGELTVAKDEWGVKRLCPVSEKRFYDLNKDPVVSPYTGEVVEIDSTKTKMISADVADLSTLKNQASEIENAGPVLEDSEDVDVDLGDDLLEEDTEDNVPLEDIADVPTDDEV